MGAGHNDERHVLTALLPERNIMNYNVRPRYLDRPLIIVNQLTLITRYYAYRAEAFSDAFV